MLIPLNFHRRYSQAIDSFIMKWEERFSDLRAGKFPDRNRVLLPMKTAYEFADRTPRRVRIQKLWTIADKIRERVAVDRHRSGRPKDGTRWKKMN